MQLLYDRGAINSLVGKDGRTVADQVALEVGNIRENMAVRRALYMKASDDAHLGTYVHSAGINILLGQRMKTLGTDYIFFLSSNYKADLFSLFRFSFWFLF